MKHIQRKKKSINVFNAEVDESKQWLEAVTKRLKYYSTKTNKSFQERLNDVLEQMENK